MTRDEYLTEGTPCEHTKAFQVCLEWWDTLINKAREKAEWGLIETRAGDPRSIFGLRPAAVVTRKMQVVRNIGLIEAHHLPEKAKKAQLQALGPHGWSRFLDEVIMWNSLLYEAQDESGRRP